MLIDCTTCGGPMPADRRCCPHCHCKNGHLKRIVLAVALGASACGGSAKGTTPNDMADMTMVSVPEIDAAYGPAPQLDFSTPDGGDAGD
jgi:hypothetical protein